MKGSEGPPAATVAERTGEKEEKCFEDHGLVIEVPLSCYLQNGPAAMISLLNSLMLVQAGGHMGLDTWDLGVLRPLALPFEQEVFPFCIPLDRWDKEFYKLQGG
ncbi:hypothetical protein ACH5RR_033949 [Cinchona calisaya]|uniref:Uncharacterized protein n=1 Tax=Cinchona calisaya TaxID=153742 RepID=A0ABD2YEX3_9GENT